MAPRGVGEGSSGQMSRESGVVEMGSQSSRGWYRRGHMKSRKA
jgi:hypothetical protein